MNNENLISLNKRTQRERKEIARKGAIATNKKKAEQKTYRELAKAMLSANITDQKILDELKAYGIEETDIKAYTLLGMIKASAEGSHNAFDRLLELAGEKNQSETEDVLTKLDEVLSGIDEVMHDEQA